MTTKPKPKTYGKKRPVERIGVEDRKIIDSTWGYIGNAERFAETYVLDLKLEPMSFLINSKNPKEQVFIAGPGMGEEIKLLKNFVKSKSGPELDVETFALTNNLSPEAKKQIKKDYSLGFALDHTDLRNPQQLRLFKKFEKKFKLIMATKSTSFHTQYPEYSSFLLATTLKSGGRAYLEILNSDSIRFHSRVLLEKRKEETDPQRIQRIDDVLNDSRKLLLRLKKIDNVILRMLSSYYKKPLEEIKKEFNIKQISGEVTYPVFFDHIERFNSTYIVIDRK